MRYAICSTFFFTSEWQEREDIKWCGALAVSPWMPLFFIIAILCGLVLSWNFPRKSLQLNYNSRCLPTAIKCQRQQRYQIWRKFKIKCREQRYELFIITPELYGRHRCRVLLAGEKHASTWGKIYTLYVRLHLSDRLFFCTRAHLFSITPQPHTYLARLLFFWHFHKLLIWYFCMAWENKGNVAAECLSVWINKLIGHSKKKCRFHCCCVGGELFQYQKK